MSEVRPKITVVMVDGSFRESFHAIRFFADQTLAASDYELLWVEHFDEVDPQLPAEMAPHAHFRTICLGHPRSGVYYPSRCFNRGIAEARGEIIVIPDADVVPEGDFLENVLRDHMECDRLVEYFHRSNEPEAEHREEVCLEHLRRVCKVTNPANHGACLSVRKRWLLEINGYDEHTIFSTGFHANDLDVYYRLRNLGLLVRWHPTQRLYHPWHPFTAAESPHYKPQIHCIQWRGAAGKTRPFEGIDPSRNDPEMPRELQAQARFLKDAERPLIPRVLSRVSRRIGFGRRAA